MQTESALPLPDARLCAESLRTIVPDKIASSTVNLGLEGGPLTLSSTSDPRPGDVVAVQVVSDNPGGSQMELTSGRLARVNPGDVVVGVLGSRRALKGFVGEVPSSLHPGDRLNILNLGGVIGRAIGGRRELGQPVEVEFLGAVQRQGIRQSILQSAIPAVDSLESCAPLILVAGTCMNSGKTLAATELIKRMTRQGLRVAAGKLSGVAALRDTLNMQDHGAVSTLSFLDCGYPSTVGLDDLAPLAKTIAASLNRTAPDAIVFELGDGVLGLYQVESVFEDRQLMDLCAAVVFSAGDFVGAWGGLQILRSKGVEVDVFTGAVTDSNMGVDYIESNFGVLAANALHNGERLHGIVAGRLERWHSSK